MRTIVKLVLLIAIVAWWVSIDNDKAKQVPSQGTTSSGPAPQRYVDSDARQKAAASIMDSSSLVTHTEWAENDILWVFMSTNEKKNWDAVAESYCKPLKLQGITGVVVSIYDSEAAAHDKMHRLGRTLCP